MGTIKDKKSTAEAELRGQAEKRLRTKKADLQTPRSEKDAKRLVHELEVHQIELEMQNAELKRAQEELELSHNKYVELYDFAPVGYFTLDAQGRIREVNLTGAKLLGIERGLLANKPFTGFITDADSKEIFAKHRDELHQKQGSQTCEIKLKRKNNAIFYAQIQSIAKKNTDGITQDIYTTIIDITERKEIEKMVFAREERYRSYIEVTGQLAWTTNPVGEVVGDIPAWRKFTGQSEDDVQGAGWSKAVHPDDIQHTMETWKKAVTKKSEYEVEYRIRRHDGVYRHFLVRGVPVFRKDGSLLEWVGTCIDITEHKKAEARIEHLASFPELSPNPVIETDLKGQIIYCNAATKKMLKKLNVPEEDIRTILPRDLTRIIKEMEQRKDGRYELLEVEINGRTFIESIILPANLQVARVYAQDITKRKQAEAALQKAHDGLETKVEERMAELQTALSEIEAMKEKLEVENIYFRHENKMKHQLDNIIGESDGLKYVLYRAEQVAPANTTVLILGETGTGKELIAAAIHDMSPRKEKPLITVNCAALPANLIESELFGREKGAFTGADSRRMGRFEVADGSTICLDEIGELPLELQIKLLRVIQHSEFERLGSSQTIKVDVRIIATTNRDIEEEIRQGRFRQDLYYRLNVFPITVPPLRQRLEDIPLMVQAFIARYSRKMGKQITSISKEAMQTLQHYPWPGNVRELESIIERSVIMCQGPVLQLADKLVISSPAMSSAVRTLEETERIQMLKILSETKWRIEGKEGAAAILGLNASTLRARMHKLGIVRPQAKKTK